jgi:prefoldin subunit 5
LSSSLILLFCELSLSGKGFAISTKAGQVGKFYTNNFELFDKLIQQLQDAIKKETESKVQELQRRRPLSTVLPQ